MRSNPLKYALIVFLAGASYGVMATTVKFAYREGFAWTQTAASQACFGVFIFAVVFIVRALMGAKGVALGPRRVLRLLGLGMTTCTTCLLYNFSLTMLPVSVAITLLFQFTWIGTVIQIVTTRRAPRPAELAAVAIILLGTFAAVPRSSRSSRAPTTSLPARFRRESGNTVSSSASSACSHRLFCSA